MSMYDGIKCPVCEKEFLPDDDVVICPECGTPHHRECYNKLGKCVNEAWHHEGKVWQQKPTVNNTANTNSKDISEEYVRCANCGTYNSVKNTVCGKCGTPLSEGATKLNAEETENIKRITNVLSDVFNTDVNENETFDKEGKVSNADLADFVGPSNLTFLLKFNMIKRKNSYPFSWSAFFLNFIYFFYRKMYKVGAIILGANMLALLPSFMVSFMSLTKGMDLLVAENMAITLENLLIAIENVMPTLSSYSWLITLSNLLGLAINLFCAMFFNRLYLNHCVNKITKIRKSFGEAVKENGKIDKNGFRDALRINGGISLLGPALGFIAYCVLFMAVSVLGAYISI